MADVRAQSSRLSEGGEASVEYGREALLLDTSLSIQSARTLYPRTHSIAHRAYAPEKAEGHDPQDRTLPLSAQLRESDSLNCCRHCCCRHYCCRHYCCLHCCYRRC